MLAESEGASRTGPVHTQWSRTPHHPATCRAGLSEARAPVGLWQEMEVALPSGCRVRLRPLAAAASADLVHNRGKPFGIVPATMAKYGRESPCRCLNLRIDPMFGGVAFEGLCRRPNWEAVGMSRLREPFKQLEHIHSIERQTTPE